MQQLLPSLSTGRVSILLLLSVFGCVYAVFAWHSQPGDVLWVFDVIEGLHQHAIDDAYRYFETRALWHNPDVWSWAYLLPVDAVFKAALHALTGSDIFLMRMGHVLVNLVGVYFLYRSCLILGVRPVVAWLASGALMIMPLFMIVSMSFYGESLLTAMAAAAMYLHLAGHRRLFCVTASLMPLVQLQGLYLISGYFLSFFLRREWRLFFLLAVPGFIYFLNVMYVHGGVFEFLSFTQLHKLYPALPVPIQERGWSGVIETLNPVFLLVVTLGGYVAGRRLWPTLAGTTFWLAQVATVMTYLNGYEPRYLLPCLPPLFAAYAVGIDRIWSGLRSRLGPHWSGLSACAILACITAENLGQSDPIRAIYLGERRWPVGEPHTAVRHFVKVRSYNSRFGEDAARRIEYYLTHNQDVKLLVVNQHNLFYYLNRRNMPHDVRVVYTPFPPLLATPAFEGAFHAVSPDHPQAAFYRFSRIPGDGERAIFVGDFSPFGWEPSYTNRNFAIYETFYEMVDPPSRIHVIHRMGRDKSNPSAYRSRNLCPGEQDVICPDWRPWVFY